MFSGGHVIIAVANLDRAAKFYTEQLGLKLTHRFGSRWVTVDAGPSYWGTGEGDAGLALGLQPHTSDYPAPGTRGAVGFGLETDLLEPLVTQYSARGVRFTSDVITFDGGKSIALADAEGNETYLWEQTEDVLAEDERSASDGDGRVASPGIAGGHAIVFVSNMDRAVQCYSEVLGFPLTFRHADKIAFVEAGRRLVIALHPTSPKYASPGTRGAVRIALQVDEPIDRVISRLAARGVPVATGRGGARASTLIEDFDGNPIEIVEDSAVGHTDKEEAVSAQSSR
jgi:catechol 2,3-dioxygenase-like lactoylglutathione lyase family enzyme